MKKCKNCNKDLFKKGANVYCSRKCQHDYQYKEYIANWKNNNVDGMMGQFQISRHIKRFLFEKYNFKCTKCKWNKVNPLNKYKLPALEVEHIDGNYKNNKEDNLTLLCPNCHSLTPTFRGYNFGNGRKERRINQK